MIRWWKHFYNNNNENITYRLNLRFCTQPYLIFFDHIYLEITSTSQYYIISSTHISKIITFGSGRTAITKVNYSMLIVIMAPYFTKTFAPANKVVVCPPVRWTPRRRSREVTEAGVYDVAVAAMWKFEFCLGLIQELFLWCDLLGGRSLSIALEEVTGTSFHQWPQWPLVRSRRCERAVQYSALDEKKRQSYLKQESIWSSAKQFSKLIILSTIKE